MTYNAKYNIPFKSISGASYEVLIEPKDYTGTSVELVGGVPPITTEYDTDDVLTPIRASKSTVSVYGSDYLKSLYASDPQGIRVRLLKEGVLEWLGFVTPDTFSQDFSKPEFIYEMECTCALSTLKYKEFAEQGETISFIQLIKNAATLAGYEKLYLTKSVCGKNGENIYEMSSVAVGNFYDELGKPMNYYEILEEVAKYLVCCTFMPYKNALYLLDYKSIRSANRDYYEYTFSNNVWNVGSADLFHFVETQDIGYKGTGATLSRIAGKNKITVNCSLYEVDNILPEFNDEKSEFARMQNVMCDSGSGKKYRRRDGIMRFYKNQKYTFYKYISDNMTEETSEALSDGQSGSCFARLASWDNGNVPGKLNFENLVLISNDKNGEIAYQDKPVITIRSGKQLLFSKGTRFGLSLTARFIPRALTFRKNWNGTPYPYWEPREIFRETKSFVKANDEDYHIEIPFTLIIGDYYYTYNGWVKKSGGAMINPIVSMSIIVSKGSYLDGVDLSVVNGNDYRMGVGDLSGFITLPMPNIIMGNVELTLYTPEGIPLNYYAYYKNIKLECAVENKSNLYGDWINKDSKNDIVFENVINDTYIEEADSIDLKICTNQDDKLCLSSVIANGDYQKEIKYLPLDTVDIAERLILKKAVDVYKKPRYVINPTVKNELKPFSMVKDGGIPYSIFIVAGGDENYAMDSFESNLIEL